MRAVVGLPPLLPTRTKNAETITMAREPNVLNMTYDLPAGSYAKPPAFFPGSTFSTAASRIELA
jgi:hypothetical protein